VDLSGLSVEESIETLGTLAGKPVQMTPECEAHLARVKAAVVERLDAKYRAGQAEHGGHVWAKPGMLRQLTNELDDLIVYRDVIEQQLREVLALMREGRALVAYQRLDDLVNGALD
jgi:hypothetical protein